MSEKIRIGFVGVGGMGQCAHLRNYATMGDCEVVAIAEVRPELGKRVAQKYMVPNVYTDFREMLSKEKLDGIVASQPFTHHGTLLPQLLEYKKPLFTEKPIAGAIEQGEKILKALAGSGTFHMVGYHKRSDPATRYAKGQIDALKASGELGKMKFVRAVMPAGDWIASGFTDMVGSNEQYPTMQWDAPAADMDKDTNDKYIGFVNYYIHQVNLIRHLLGESYQFTYADPAGVLAVGHSTSGIPVSLEMSAFCTTIDWQEHYLVCFEKGWVKVELPAPVAMNRPGKTTIYRDPGNGATPTESSPQLPWVHAMRQQAQNFLDSIKGACKPPCEAAEALEDIKVARQYIKLWTDK